MFSTSQPESQMAARGMSCKRDPFSIQRVMLGEEVNVFGTSGDVLEGARPAAALVSHSAVLQGPDRNSAVGQVSGRSGHVTQVVLRQPAASMQQHHHGEWTFAIG